MSETDVEAGGRLLNEILSLERGIAWLQARQLARIATFDDHHGGARDTTAELALALSISERAAGRKLELAAALVTRLPNTLSAMEHGEIDTDKARTIAHATECLSGTKAHAVDTALAGTLAGKDPSRVRRAARRAVHRIDPDGAAERARARRADRRVELGHGPDNMATLTAELPTGVASAAYARIDRKARALREAGETRTVGQLRADVLAELLLSTPARPRLPHPRRRCSATPA